MREIILIRHGLTHWNRERRIQGQTDVPLSEDGIHQVGAWRLPDRYRRQCEWYVSNLGRARQTASLLGVREHRTSAALMEMDWGSWTGRRITDLRVELGESMRKNERRGLDFQPPGGESPRMVRNRLEAWLTELRESDPRPVCAVTHKGVIRAAISLATGWDLKSDYEEKLIRDACHRFHLVRGALRLDRLNIPLESNDGNSPRAADRGDHSRD